MIFFLLLLVSWAQASTFSCNTQYDDLGIPHIKTSSEEEYYYCFGLQHATDRAWEMDFFRRLAQGRNAEVLGFSQLKSDLMMRFLNLEEKANELWKDFPVDARKKLEAYADGVNEGFKSGKGAREFIDKGYEPEKWLPEHSVLVLLIQSFDQTRKSFFFDYEEEKKKEVWGKKAEELFDEDNLPWNNTILKDGEYQKKALETKKTSYLQGGVKLWADFPKLFGEETGSNNWAVSGKKSASGKAIFANDPHLDLKTPMFWYWLHIQSPHTNMIGASVPGAPIIASGTNGNVAWGLTNAYINTADAIFAKDLPKSSIVSIRPWVKVKFWFFTIPFFFKTFETTSDGYRVLPLEIESEYKMLLRWTGFSLKANDVLSMFDMPSVKNVTEMDSLLSKMHLPAWNYVFADKTGDIGFRVVGKSYKHTHKLPFGIPVMTMDEIRKEEFLSAEEMPHVLKPKRNYVYTANHRHWPADAAFYGGRAYSMPFRGFRIEELLQEKQTPGSFKNIQCDRQVVDARFFLPKILQVIKSPDLESWTYTSEDHSLALPLYRRFMDVMMENWKVNENALYRILLKPSLVQRKEMRRFFKMAQKDVKGKNWSDIHKLGFVHLSKNAEWKFSPEIAGPGDNHSVDPGTATWNPERKVYEQTSGASMRMIIEMSERPVVELTLPGLNRNYTEKSSMNPWESWKACRYTRISF